VLKVYYITVRGLSFVICFTTQQIDHKGHISVV